MHLLLQIATLWIAVLHIDAEPIELTDEYIKLYQNGFIALQKEAMDYKPTDKQLNFSEITKNATATPLDPEMYDFIIIGGGTSGSVLASRLSEIPEWNVLLLEAGDDETKITKVPAVSRLLRRTRHIWPYLTTPQTNWCQSSPDKKCPVLAGRIMGGTSSVNDMLYIRGNRRDFDLWADDGGHTKWCYDDVLPHFLKSENANLQKFDRNYHKQGGLYYIEEPQYITNNSARFMRAANEFGVPSLDYNGKVQLGASIPQMNTYEGERSSSASAFLNHLHRRKNLNVIPLSLVVGIEITQHSKDAQGVKFLHNGEIKTAKAKKEVLLAGGAINSAKLLMLSGVGPKEHLKSLGIDVLSDLPVGASLKDHPVYPLRYHYNATDIQDENEREEHENALLSYLKSGKGPLTTSGIDGIAFLKTLREKVADYPDITLQLKSDIPELLQFDIMLNHPKSTGTIRLQSADPLHDPLIDLNHYSDSDDDDLSTMLEGTKQAIKFAQSESFAELNAHPLTVKECRDTKAAHEYWTCALRHRTYSAGHYSGTCKMGGVVDDELRVKGVNKLRVIDASVIPISITGDLTATTVMIGEKAADLIKEAWNH